MTSFGDFSADIDECDMEVHGCMHTCNNTQGSYECLCGDGYELMENGRNCTGKPATQYITYEVWFDAYL